VKIPIRRHSDFILTFGVVGMIFLLMVPISPMALDALICLSLIFSVMTLLVVLNLKNTLEFNQFPSALLLLTLLRLGLNMASTRLILTRAEAGAIIHTFGDFVIQKNLLAGAIVFYC
jgi:flagellar biosynthesis protein FlhA